MNRKELFKTLSEARKSQGITQKMVAQKMGIGQAEVSEMERGLFNTSTDALVKYADAVGMEISATTKSIVTETSWFNENYHSINKKYKQKKQQ
jgi:transcriptional regulator with XRE-family HTH domain